MCLHDAVTMKEAMNKKRYPTKAILLGFDDMVKKIMVVTIGSKRDNLHRIRYILLGTGEIHPRVIDIIRSPFIVPVRTQEVCCRKDIDIKTYRLCVDLIVRN